jgi:hypothetical protein
LNRHPPDAGLAEAEIAAFDGLWQRQTLDTGLSWTQTGDIGAWAFTAILMGFSFRLVSGHFLTGPGAASVRRKLPGL